VLFYYWTGSRNRPYRSQKRYGLGARFKPRAGQITFSSIISQGILQELDCVDSVTVTVDADVEPCQIGLYTVALSSGATRRDFPVLCGRTDSGRPLSEDECKALLALPVQDFTEDSSRPHWLKRGGTPHPLDELVPVAALTAREGYKLSPDSGRGKRTDEAALQCPKSCAGA